MKIGRFRPVFKLSFIQVFFPLSLPLPIDGVLLVSSCRDLHLSLEFAAECEAAQNLTAVKYHGPRL